MLCFTATWWSLTELLPGSPFNYKYPLFSQIFGLQRVHCLAQCGVKKGDGVLDTVQTREVLGRFTNFPLSLLASAGALCLPHPVAIQMSLASMETIALGPAAFQSPLCLAPRTPTQTTLARPEGSLLTFPIPSNISAETCTHSLPGSLSACYLQTAFRGRGGPCKRLFLHLAGCLTPEEGRGLDMALLLQGIPHYCSQEVQGAGGETGVYRLFCRGYS